MLAFSHFIIVSDIAAGEEDKEGEEGEECITPFDQYHCDATTLPSTRSPQRSLMFKAHDETFTPSPQLGFAFRHCTPYTLAPCVYVVSIWPQVFRLDSSSVWPFGPHGSPAPLPRGFAGFLLLGAAEEEAGTWEVWVAEVALEEVVVGGFFRS